ncbi:MAG TPA: TonB-dependent receptor [Puia sp.]|jgi:iron complex outermembrane receptor protein
MNRTIVTFCFLFIFYFSSAQTGKITDGNSRPIPGATITVLNTNYTAIADGQGQFHLPVLRPGTYTIVVSAVGFATTSHTINAGGSHKEDLNLQLPAANSQLDEVVVTAQKKQELLQHIPLSVTALSQRQVSDYRLWNSKDITAIAPDLYSADPGDGRNATGIRGITTTSYTPAVATYIDGVNQFSLDSYIFQLLDVERIEILRGPQGTLYGRNAMGGVINIITKQPTNTFNGFAEVSIGNYGRQRYSLGFRAPLIKDKLFIGAAGLYDGRNGYYHNDFTNSSYEDQHSFTGNYYIKYLPAKNWDLTLNVKHVDNRNHGPFPLVADDPFKDPFVLSQNAVTTMIDNTINAGLSINYKGPGFIFSSQTAWQQNYRYYTQPIDGDFSPLDALTINNNFGPDWNKTKTWTQEFKFSSPAGTTSPWNWTAGAYLFHNDAPVKQATHYGKDAAALGSLDSNFATINTTKSINKGIAFYGQVGYALTQRLQLTAGLRYDYEHQWENILGEYQPDGSSPITTTPDTSGKTSFHAWSPKGTLSYTLSKDYLVYGSYSRGFRTGGLTQLSSDPTTEPPLYAYRPEYSNNFELGWKMGLFRNLLKINLTAFYSNIHDAQEPTLILPDAITVTRNAGKLNSKGLEAEIATTPVKGLELNYNFGYTHARFDDLKLSQNGSVVDLSGKHQVFTPDVTSMLAAQYSYPLGLYTSRSNRRENQVQLVARGEWRYLGNTWFDLANTIEQKGYSLFNASLAIRTKNYSLSFWERNLTNKRYIAYAYDFGAAHLGDPQTYGATLGVKF